MTDIDFEKIATQNADLTKAARLDERRRIGIVLLAAFGVTLDNAPDGVKKVFEDVIKEVFLLDDETKAAIESGDEQRGKAAFGKVMADLDIDPDDLNQKSTEYIFMMSGADALAKLQEILNKMRNSVGKGE